MATCLTCCCCFVLFLAVVFVNGTSTNENGAMPCDDGREQFCNLCHQSTTIPKDVCDTLQTQCRKSFCKPICLRMAFDPVITVRCEKAPLWKDCEVFKKELKLRDTSVLAQFRAHICGGLLGCCSDASELTAWLDPHIAGDRTGHHVLPLPSCELSRTKETAADDVARTMPSVCAMCRAAVDFQIRSGENCVREESKDKDVLPFSLQQRCHFVADLAGNLPLPIVRHLKSRVCSCAGCCADEGCFYQHDEDAWIHSLMREMEDKIATGHYDHIVHNLHKEHDNEHYNTHPPKTEL
eukprot:GILK01010015.1.p1 GENE.GILK01010015.1~~GILK01010015.1.p1  ORF type:complete len:295 (-),score=30.53 GILK01010015.1:499-1383(-)